MSQKLRTLHFENFDQLHADAVALRERGFERGGEWDLAMIENHLAKSIVGPLDGQGPRLWWPAGAIARAVIRRMVRKNWYPTMKVPAPGFMQPQKGIAPEPAAEQFDAAIARARDQTGPTVTTRAFGTLATADWKGLQLLHAAHHLAFLKPR